jgi:hypothetical protein
MSPLLSRIVVEVATIDWKSELMLHVDGTFAQLEQVLGCGYFIGSEL